jgi:L-ornithine N5-oxygenase
VTLTLHDTLGRSAPCTTSYDVVVCGTGYDRSAWLELLSRGTLGARFGLESKARTREIEIVPVPDGESVPAPPSARTSRSSSPASAGSDLGGSLEEPPVGQRLFVSRAYRALPIDDSPAPRIYLQGCLEATHGLSDTLLSVMGVKVGEIVQDLMQSQTAGV